MGRYRFASFLVLILVASLSPVAVRGSTDGVWHELFLPDLRQNAAQAYDPTHDQLVIVGGGWFRSYQDVWVHPFQTDQWVKLAIAGPAPTALSSATLIYDPPRDRFILFGGSGPGGPVSEVWALSLTGSPSWTQLAPSGAAPPPRILHAAAYDPTGDQMIVAGGLGALIGGAPALADCWALSLSGTPAWSQLSATGPGARMQHTLVLDETHERLLLFGGVDHDGGVPLGDVWALPLAPPGNWSQIAAADPAVARLGHVAVTDPDGDRMVVFGGNDVTGEETTSLWALSLSVPPTWNSIVPSGAAQFGHTGASAVFDPVRRRMVMFGGYSFEAGHSRTATRGS